MVFGRKRKPPTGHYVPEQATETNLPRSRTSCRRPLPPASAITRTMDRQGKGYFLR